MERSDGWQRRGWGLYLDRWGGGGVGRYIYKKTQYATFFSGFYFIYFPFLFSYVLGCIG